ncbi:tetratricopeptide repeat protein [Pseudomonas sp. CAN2814]|nr:tetratricopeptide repeat protein [Pseudomonas sp. CAN1]MDN6859176.1 tetratricopeptide repeat protein [Pseudomonas sp. CAN1]
MAADSGARPGLAKDREGYADAASCLGCHQEQAEQWQQSDHSWAMRDAKAGNVLGNFADQTFEDAGVSARFFQKDGRYFVHTEGRDGKPGDFPIQYSFGHYPLQQYLVSFPNGHLQVLTIAWDSRPKEAGGQRWFSLYPGQRFAPDDALHWTGRFQNWNAMCADCHSTRLMKHYDDKTDAFATTWQEQTVGCQGCHGPSQAHVDWAKQNKSASKTYASAKEIGLPFDFKALSSQELVGQCAFCHSRRQTLGVGQQPGHPQLDTSLPATLRAGLYHADGQIDGEVYEFGSFSQSKMYAAGVACTDCHNPHTGKVRIEGNGLCTQCHNANPPVTRFAKLQAKNYDSPEHHHHPAGSPGAQCVNCHMASKNYMVVDPRRDHDFRLPRPDLTEQTGSPDACTACHSEQKPAWAAKAIEGWFGSPKRPKHYGEAFHAVRQGDPGSVSLLGAVIADIGSPPIVRASAAQQLVELGQPGLNTLRWALNDDSALVRAYAIPGFARMPPEPRARLLLAQLDDTSLAVRDEALKALADVPLEAIPAERRDAFSQQLADYEKRLRGNADLPGGRLNLAVFLQRRGQTEQAIEQYQQALRLDAHFIPARVNLVTLYSGSNQSDKAEQLLREGLALDGLPATDHGNLAYMLALLLVEHGNSEEGVKWMSTAADELPGNARVRYNQGLLLAQLRRPGEAASALAKGLETSPDDPDLLYALIYLHTSAGQLDQAKGYVQRLQQVAPNDPRLEPINRQWGNPAQ